MKDTICCYGEVLWDVLPGGTVPGGAPINVAYHLNKLGHSAAVISRVGKDEDGEKLVRLFSEKGVPMQLVQTDETLPTGMVFGKPDAQLTMHYDIVQPSAWDNIEATDAALEAVRESKYFIFGSLASRSETSAATLNKLLTVAQTKVCDINLRTPHYDKETIEHLLQQADILKLNEEELAILNDWFVGNGRMDEQMRMLQAKFNLKAIVLTLGAQGAVLVTEGKFICQGGMPVNVADTVGSGDAFLAAFLHGREAGLSHEKTMEQACRLGAFIATKNGACPEYDLADLAG